MRTSAVGDELQQESTQSESRKNFVGTEVFDRAAIASLRIFFGNARSERYSRTRCLRQEIVSDEGSHGSKVVFFAISWPDGFVYQVSQQDDNRQ